MLMFNVQLCLTFERVYIMLKFWLLPLCRRVGLIVRLWITALILWSIMLCSLSNNFLLCWCSNKFDYELCYRHSVFQ